jgi:hypothetical protein
LQFDDGDALVLLTEFFLLFLKDQFWDWFGDVNWCFSLCFGSAVAW